MIEVTYTRLDINAGGGDVRRLLDYWESLRGDTFAPAWPAFDWADVPPAFIPHMGIVDVVADPLDFVYRFWGTAHADVLDQEMTGRSVREMVPKEEGESVFRQYQETLEAGKPMLFENRLTFGEYARPIIETSLRLPFSDDGDAISHLMAFSDLREDFKYLKKALAT